MLYSLDMAPVSNTSSPDSETAMMSRQKAGFLYSQVFARGRWQAFWHKLVGKENFLRELPQTQSTAKRLPLKDSSVVLVPLEKIVGSEGRVRDFDQNFNPLADHNNQRWISVAVAHRQGKTLPPVDLIQIGDEYYDRDGHHRISVAKAAGQAVIEAEIAYASV